MVEQEAREIRTLRADNRRLAAEVAEFTATLARLKLENRKIRAMAERLASDLQKAAAKVRR